MGTLLVSTKDRTGSRLHFREKRWHTAARCVRPPAGQGGREEARIMPQAHLRDIVGSEPDRLYKANIAIESIESFGFPVPIEVMFP